MKYILDTHLLIFLGTNDIEKISKKALKIYQNPVNELFISQISYWEMAIKINLGKLIIPVGLRSIMLQTHQAGIQMIPVRNEHILNYESLPRFDNHKDPFDRFIVSVTLNEKAELISSDKKFDLYKSLKRVW